MLNARKTIQQHLKNLISAFTLCIILTSQLQVAVGANTQGDPSANQVPGSNTVKPALMMHQNISLGSQGYFEENKGQLLDHNHKPLSTVLYYAQVGSTWIYCKPGMLSFVLTKTETQEAPVSEATGKPVTENTDDPHTPQNKTVSYARMDMVLVGANPNAKISASGQQAYFENFYNTGDANNGITDVHTYAEITYKDIYRHIDMILKQNKTGLLEYSFLVHPGGRVADIKMQWLGANHNWPVSKTGTDGRQAAFCHINSLGRIEESTPLSFSGAKAVPSRFTTHGAIHGFAIGDYDQTQDLVIDPVLWATYYGGSQRDEVKRMVTDGSGNIYLAGVTASSSGIATSGAYQTTGAASAVNDAFVAKFTASGSIGWATYYGGSGADQANGIAISGSNLYVVGLAGSSGMATSGASQTSYQGSNDAFLAQFSTSGSLGWATYYGGTGADQGNGVTVDASGNIDITGITASSGLGTSGSFKSTYIGGNSDAFVAQFSSSGSLTWATYFGGTSADEGDVIYTDASGNVYIGGQSGSKNIATSGAYFVNTKITAGYHYAFIAKFNSTGTTCSWATNYGGGSEFVNGIYVDGSGSVYISGYTTGGSNMTTSGAYQTSSGGYQEAYMAKFNSTGTSLTWGTYFGGSGRDYFYGMAVDGSGNLFATGYTTTTSGLATSGAYQTAIPTGGSQSALLVEFSSSGSLTYSTYYGNGEAGNDISIDAGGNIFIVGISGSSSSLATSGAYQTTNNGNLDGFITKFSLPKTWAGTTTSWNTAGNWSPNGVPTSSDSVVIPSSLSTYPTLDADANVKALNILSGATVTGASSYSLTVSKDISGAGTLNAVTSTVNIGGSNTVSSYNAGSSSTTVFNGSSAQSVTGTYNNLTVNNSAGLTLSANTTVNGTLYLQAGILKTGNHKLILGSSGSISGGGSGNYIFTNGNGTLEITTQAGANLVPIGDGYNPITITDAVGGHVFDVSVNNGILSNSGTSITDWAVNRTWRIVSATSATVTVTPQWAAPGDLIGTNFDLTKVAIGYRDSTTGSTWTVGTNTDISGQSSPYTITSGSISLNAGDVYQIGVGSGTVSPLPVSLVSFIATNNGGYVDLKWQTASEINNDYFDVERSVNGTFWNSIAHIPGHGNSLLTNNYATNDHLEGIIPGTTVYYRLKQVDYNGQFAYSPIRAVNFENNGDQNISTYPNPVHDQLTITLQNQNNSQTSIKLLDMNGVAVYTEMVNAIGNIHKTIDMSHLPSGTYYLQVVNGQSVTNKMVYKE